MDIKSRLRKSLLEGKHKGKNDYGCVMVFFKYNQKNWKGLQDLIDKEDLYEEEDDSSYGLENEPHATLLYGLHEDVKDDEIKDKVGKISSLDFDLGNISSFNNEKFDVVKFDIESKDFNKYNKDLGKLPHTNSYKDYHAHTTIAYVKSGKAEKYIPLLKKFIKDNVLEFSTDKIVYSKVDGSKINYEI